MHRLNRMHSIETMPPRRTKTKLFAQPIEKIRAGLFPDAHGAIALHVAVTTDGTQARARLSHLSTEQHQVDDLLNVGDGVLVLSQAHGPAEDHALGFHEDARGIFDLDLGDAGLIEDVAPVDAAQRCFELFEPCGVAGYELVIQYTTRPAFFGVEEFLHDPFQQCHVAINPDLQKKISQLGALAQPGPNFLPMLEARQSSFRRWSDVDDFA